jgi:hypothetical protein
MTSQKMVLLKVNAVKTSVSHEYTYFDCSLMALVRIPYKLRPKLKKSELINKIGNVRRFPSTVDKRRITLIYNIPYICQSQLSPLDKYFSYIYIYNTLSTCVYIYIFICIVCTYMTRPTGMYPLRKQLSND